MTGLGTLVNMAAILIGSGLGLLLKNGIPKRLQTTISSAVGLCLIFVGITAVSYTHLTLTTIGFV